MSRQLTTPASVLVAGLIIIVLALAGTDLPSQGAAGAVFAYPNYPSGSTSTPTQTATVTSTSVTQTNATTAAVATTAIPTITTAVPPTLAPASPTLATTPTPSLTPTPSATPLPDTERTCVPGQPVEIAGEGPPNAGVLMYFDGRAVGGGSVGVSGRFALSLVVGNEKPGRYPVRVQVRGGQQVLRALDCVVPARSTPSSTPVGG